MTKMVEVNFSIDELSIIMDWYSLLFASDKQQRIKFEPKDKEKQLLQKACFMARQMIDEHEENHDIFSDDDE